MTDRQSPRQQAMIAIWSSHGPDDLIDILASQPSARDPSLIAELTREAEACEQVNPHLATRLHQMSETLREIHAATTAFANVVDLASLVTCLRMSDLAWHPSFPNVMEGLVQDYASDEQQTLAQGLRMAVEVHQTAKRGFKLVEELSVCTKGDVWDFFERHPILCDPAFHEILGQAVIMAQEAKYPGIADMQGMREYLMTVCRIRASYQAQREAIPDEDGRIHVRLPTTPEQASIWFRLLPGLSEVCRRLAPEVAQGHRSFAELAEMAAAELPLEARRSVAQAKILAITALCEHVLCLDGHTRTEEALAEYRAALDSPEFRALEDEEQRTYVLRYGMALQRTWRQCDDPAPLIHSAVDLLGAAIARTDPNISPRLLRDLYFTRARHLENLGKWSPAHYPEAEQDYEAGLKVSGAAHEVEARAMALSDLANTVRRRYGVQIAEQDRRIIALYEEALGYLSPREHPLSRSGVLNNFATYFNERVIGDPVKNEERALALAAESVKTLEDMVKGRSLTVFEKIDLASAYNTKANILRHRTHGDRREQLHAAKEVYEAAIALVDPGLHDDLLATLWLNLGHVEIDLGREAGDGTCLRRAMESYSKAESVAGDYPQQYARAVIAMAGLALEGPYRLDREFVDRSINAVVSVLDILAHIDNPDDLARAHFILGLLYRAKAGRQSGQDLDRAVASFREAYERYKTVGSLEHATSVAREAADCYVARFQCTGERESLNGAKTLLFEASHLVETLWKRLDSVEWRQEISASFAEVYGELAWCEAMLGASPYEVLLSATRAKGREILEQVSGLVRQKKGIGPELGEYLDILRIQERLAEIGRWAVQRQVEGEGSILTDLESADRVAREAGRERELFEGVARTQDLTVKDLAEQVELFLRSHPHAAICDLTVCRWGTVIVYHTGPSSPSTSQPQVFTVSLTRPTLEDLLWGRGEQPGWNDLYQTYISATGGERSERRRAWAQATDNLLAVVAREALHPVLDLLNGDNGGRSLYFVPGVLAGMPLHAIQLPRGGHLCDAVKGLAYVPSLTMLTADKPNWKWPDTALCVLSDPEVDPANQLRAAPAEAAGIATRLDLLGSRVTVVAAVGTDVGPDVFAQRGISLPQTVTVLQERPTPEWLRTHARAFDHIFYAGHGLAAHPAGPGGLVVSDAEGAETLWTSEDVLVTPELQSAPLVFLSACETARDALVSTGTDLFSFASCLLRIGSGFVLGALWTVRDDHAHLFTNAFYDGLMDTWDPAEAFCRAVRGLRDHVASSQTGRTPSSGQPAAIIDWACFMLHMSL